MKEYERVSMEEKKRIGGKRQRAGERKERGKERKKEIESENKSEGKSVSM